MASYIEDALCYSFSWLFCHILWIKYSLLSHGLKKKKCFKYLGRKIFLWKGVIWSSGQFILCLTWSAPSWCKSSSSFIRYLWNFGKQKGPCSTSLEWMNQYFIWSRLHMVYATGLDNTRPFHFKDRDLAWETSWNGFHSFFVWICCAVFFLTTHLEI